MYVYADNAASTILSKKAARAMEKCFFELYGNPSGVHEMGRVARRILEKSRQNIAGALNVNPDGIYFTSGGTESDNWAIRLGQALGEATGKKHIISTQIEHHAVKKPLERLEEEGFEVTYIRPSKSGRISAEDFEKEIRRDTIFASVMYVNNVTGVIQPIREIGKICRSHGILFHTDAVQAVGHIPINVKEDFVDMLSASAHKFHGPKGVGFLYCGRGEFMKPLILGGGQERGMRSGTENVSGIFSMAEALSEATANMAEEMEYVNKLRRIAEEYLYKIRGVRINGDMKMRVPGILNVSIEGVSGKRLVSLLDEAGICVSLKSACSSGREETDFVLESMGIPAREANNAFRISLSVYNSEEEIVYMVNKIKEAVERLRGLQE